MNNDNESLIFNQDDRSHDIDFIMEMVKESGTNILTPEEMDAYVQYAQRDMPEDNEKWHYDNLAEDLDDTVLKRIASEVISWVDADEESREDWATREAKGIKLLGVSDENEGGAAFDGASEVVHPLIMEGIVQFQARAIAELWPKAGPVKTIITGETTQDLQEKAARVEKYGNYLYTQKMPGAFEEMDQLLFRLPLSGSCFKKVYFDPIANVVCSRLVEPSDFIVPYTATDLRSAPRYTHRIKEQKNDVLKKIKSGFYKETRLSNPFGDDIDYSVVREQIDRTEGVTRSDYDSDQRYTILEMYVEYDLPDHNDIDKNGEDTGIALPYIITVNKDDQTVLRIQRNWKEDDEFKSKKVNFSHYKFTPGFGFYGYGLLHLIGGLGNAATGAFRALMDSAQYENLQGGFLSEDARFDGSDKPIAPGEWRRVNSSAEELSKSFFPLPRTQPSPTLFNLLGYLDDKAQRLASTTDAMVGDAPASMAVGTAMQNMENGSKVFSAIHARLHEAQSKEFSIVVDLIRDHIPEEGYPFAIGGVSGMVMIDDFSDEINVIPISDPNLISQGHRIAQAQGIMQLADKGTVNKIVATRLMLEAMRVANIDELMEIEQSDPLSIEAMQLEIEKLKSEIANKDASTDKIKAEAVNKSIESTFSAMSSAEKAVITPEIVPVADAILNSSGFEDKNGYPIAPQVNAVELPEPQMNTNPLTPMNPAVGINAGIESGDV